METIFIGIFYIALGILIKFFPGLLAGYGSLSQKEKENAKNNGVPTFAMIVFCIMGVITILGYFIELWIELPNFSRTTYVLVTFVGIVVLIIGGNIILNLRRTN